MTADQPAWWMVSAGFAAGVVVGLGLALRLVSLTRQTLREQREGRR